METGKETETTPTAEEQLATLQQQIDQVTKERDETKKGLSTAHSRLTEKDLELKKRAELDTRLDGLEATQRFLIGALQEKGYAPDDETLETKKTDYLQQYDNLVSRKKAEREQESIKAQQEEYNRRADAVYARAKEAYGDDDESLEKIEDLLSSGRIDRAEAKLEKAVKTTDTKKKVESEDERFARRLEEEKRKWMEETGQLESETGVPSASGGLTGLTRESLDKKLKAPGGVQWFKENEKEIDRLYMEGKI